MTVEDEETTAINKLLTCSDKFDGHERFVAAYSLDEICSWKAIAPMCIYVRPKRKKDRREKNELKKRKLHYYKELSFEPLPNKQYYEPLPSDNDYPFRQHWRNLAYFSTNVLSYDNPSSRYIVDRRTFDYIERDNYTIISNYFKQVSELPDIDDPNISLKPSQPAVLEDGNGNITIGDSDCYIDKQLLANLEKKLCAYKDYEDQYEEIPKASFYQDSELLKETRPISLFQIQRLTARQLVQSHSHSGVNLLVSYDESIFGDLYNSYWRPHRSLAYHDQVDLVTSKLTADDSMSNMVLRYEDKRRKNYEDIKRKSKMKRKEDNQLLKVRTFNLPTLDKPLGRRAQNSSTINDDESEDDIEFPFRVKSVRNGKKVDQDISIEDSKASLVNEPTYTSYTKERMAALRMAKVKDKLELPPICGLFIS